MSGPASMIRLTIWVPISSEADVEAWFWERGALAITSFPPNQNLLEMAALFPDHLDQALRIAVEAWLPSLDFNYSGPKWQVVDTSQWRQMRRQAFQSMQVGKLWLVADSDPEPENIQPTERMLRVFADHAFGTGDHQTTRLMLKALQVGNLTEKRVLDVGCGTGILAIAAEKLGAAWCEGFDNDIDCQANMRHHLAWNHCQKTRLWIGSFASVKNTGFDWILANVTLNVHREMGAYLDRWVNGGGRVLGSGVMLSQWEATVQSYAEHGWRVHREAYEDPWICFVGVRR